MAYHAVIERIVEHTKDTRSLFLRLPDGQSFAFTPGQFLSFTLPVNGQVLTRPYSIASDPGNGALLEICFNLVPGGLGSHYLWSRVVSDVLQFTGPWGTFVVDQPPQAECVFVAEGVGIAPLRPMIKRALRSGGRMAMRLLYYAVSEDALLFRSEFLTLEKDKEHFYFEPLVSNPSMDRCEGNASLIEEIEKRYILADSDRSRQFYICGVGSLITTIRDLLRQAGYQRRAVRYEKW